MKYITPYTKHPRNNLPNGKKRRESNFVLAFGRAYYKEIEKILTKKDIFEIAREFYIPGLGIADIVSVFREPCETKISAFEMKIKGWRRALAQAYRYKYYADEVFVVLPSDEAKKAKQSLEMFKMLNIGLMAFDVEKERIEKILRPEKDKHMSPASNNKALSLLSQKFKSLPAP